MMKKTMMEMEIDLDKMPLGALSRAQIEKGYKVTRLINEDEELFSQDIGLFSEDVGLIFKDIGLFNRSRYNPPRRALWHAD